MERKKLPVGIENFAEIRQQDFYYVDKTGLIEELLEGWGKVNLFTRPRRFGKTLNMSMLKSFFQVGTSPDLFQGLAIARNQTLCRTYQGKYPVVYVSLKGVDGPDYETACGRLKEILLEEASRLQYLLDSDRISATDKLPLRLWLEREKEAPDLAASLRIFCKLLEKHYGRKTILLIDEYDVPLDKAYQYGYYQQMADLIRAMFGAALKTNDSLFFAVLTGCLRVSKESIFTGLNNLMVHSISDVKYEEYFGFGEQDVAAMLTYYGLEAHGDQMREWYDGYRFGDRAIYCPWDVINYCYTLRSDPLAEPRAYWINTSGNDMVKRLICHGSAGTTQMEIESLIAGGRIVKTLNENLTHNEIDENLENIWSLLYMTGYLTSASRPSEGRYSLRIPNKEILQIYKQQVLQWFRDKIQAEAHRLASLYAAFERGEGETIREFLDNQLLDTVSFYDAYESFYHGFLLALLSTCGDWQVTSNAETGRGRSDILVQRKDRKVGFVVEIKNVREEKELDAACQKAMKQIEERDYTALLRRYRVKKIWTYAIAFWEKECKVLVGSVLLPCEGDASRPGRSL